MPTKMEYQTSRKKINPWEYVYLIILQHIDLIEILIDNISSIWRTWRMSYYFFRAQKYHVCLDLGNDTTNILKETIIEVIICSVFMREL
jgi:hypothetical protein